jgi:uncharacterized membrane protein
MTRAEFLDELRKRLKKLPSDEQAYAMTYYEEYLEEAGATGEQAAIAALGSPAQVASAIISEYAIKQVNAEKNPGENPAKKKESGNLKTLWIVILAVIASPIALPLAIALVVSAFAVLLTIFLFYLTLFLLAITMMAGGILSIGAAVVDLYIAPPKAALVLGIGLMSLALGAALFIFSVWISRLTIKGTTRLFARLLRRKGGQS